MWYERQCPATHARMGIAVGMIALLGLSVTAAVSARSATPAADHDRTMMHHGPDCPGRAHRRSEYVTSIDDGRTRMPHGAEPAPLPPALQHFDAGPYGIILGYAPRAKDYPRFRLLPSRDYRARLYHMTDCPQAPVDDRFIGLDRLITGMGHRGLKFYRSPIPSVEAGPDGIIAADDVVVIKINYQWPERGGTNIDVLRGLIRRIVDHPDTFTGEVIVCENAQFNSVQNFDRALNNAEDHGLSPHDVVVAFQDLGHNVSHYDWTSIRVTQVAEYSEGDTTSGYILYNYDPQLHGRVSYPKFQAASGTQISLRHGIWDPDSETYDRERLKFINVPVLKSHHATYGATACVKDYMGVVTGELGTNSHSAIRYGILGELLGEIRLADLNILDCIWINANPYDGPWTTYAGATRRDELVVSLDPVAADIWAVKNILIPAFLANGYSPPWPYPSADPDDPNSEFREYLDNSMGRIILAGYEVTNDPEQIDVFAWSGAGDLDGDGVDDDADNCPYHANPGQEDCDEDGIGDVCAIADGLSEDCNVNGIPDECDIADGTSGDVNENGIPDECECLADFDGDDDVDTADLLTLLAQWGGDGSGGGDVDLDGDVDTADLLLLLAAWGDCPQREH
jgi:hypothetical protein